MYEFLEIINADNYILISINRIQCINFGKFDNIYSIGIVTDNGDWVELFDDKQKAQTRYNIIKEIIKSSTYHFIDTKMINPTKKISDLNWSGHAPATVERRIVNCLHSKNILTVEDVLKHTLHFYMLLPNFGNKCLHHLVKMFESLNLPIRKGGYNDLNN